MFGKDCLPYLTAVHACHVLLFTHIQFSCASSFADDHVIEVLLFHRHPGSNTTGWVGGFPNNFGTEISLFSNRGRDSDKFKMVPA